MSSNETKVSCDALFGFCAACFEKLGLSAEDAAVTAENLLFANLRGVDSHGVIRLKVYADRLRAGGFKADVHPEIISEGDACASLDARQGVGQVAGLAAMKLAMAKAEQAGAALVSVRNSNHFGAAAFYALKAIDRGMIGLAATNAGASMAPTGGREGRLGNNPVAIAVPAGKYPPLTLDMATGSVAWGKIFLAQQKGEKIPAAWALDKHGVPTDDPNAAADRGLIQPLGGYKGYGLSLFIDILTGVLGGGAFSTQVKSLYQSLETPSGSAQAFAAIRIDAFLPRTEFCKRVDQLIELMHSCPLAPGVERIFVPGEIEHETAQRRKSEGIPVNAKLRDELVALAQELRVPSPFSADDQAEPV
ncbi:MAG: Ldh family oxidoreductase [Verrucomicrobia bacterium]|nr:Ldh family oxidoreductase [Verrucomicrobiota bacterium]